MTTREEWFREEAMHESQRGDYSDAQIEHMEGLVVANTKALAYAMVDYLTYYIDGEPRPTGDWSGFACKKLEEVFRSQECRDDMAQELDGQCDGSVSSNLIGRAVEMLGWMDLFEPKPPKCDNIADIQAKLDAALQRVDELELKVSQYRILDTVATMPVKMPPSGTGKAIGFGSF